MLTFELGLSSTVLGDSDFGDQIIGVIYYVTAIDELDRKWVHNLHFSGWFLNSVGAGRGFPAYDRICKVRDKVLTANYTSVADRDDWTPMASAGEALRREMALLRMEFNDWSQAVNA